jgi:hypothetical protein
MKTIGCEEEERAKVSWDESLDGAKNFNSPGLQLGDNKNVLRRLGFSPIQVIWLKPVAIKNKYRNFI